MVIDIHAHVVPVDALRRAVSGNSRLPVEAEQTEAGTWRFRFVGGAWTRPVAPMLSDVAARVAWMDQQGIDVQCNGGWLDVYGYDLAPEEGAAWSRILNDALVESLAVSKGRLLPLATVPLQDGRLAAQELRRAMTDLRAAGVMIASEIPGVLFDSPSLEPFWAEAEALGAPIVLHPPNNLIDARLKNYGLVNVLGRAVDTTIAALYLIAGGVLDRHPGLKIVLSHGGGFLPYQIGRLQREYEGTTDLRARLKYEPTEYLRRFYYDTALFDPRSVRFLIEMVGVDRVCLGTDQPFHLGDPAPVRTVAAVGLPPGDTVAVVSGNALRILPGGVVVK